MTIETSFDIALNNSAGYYDISIDDSGDIKTEDSFKTMLLMIIYCDKRANESEMQDAKRRRGWIGNELTPGFEIGSKLWLYHQERLTATLLSEISAQLELDCKILIDDNLLSSISVEPIFNYAEVGVKIFLKRNQSETEIRYFKLWDRTK